MSKQIARLFHLLIVALIVGAVQVAVAAPTIKAVSTATPTALISPQTLKSWIDAGLVNNAKAKNKVVILEIGPSDVPAGATYPAVPGFESGHIPGAVHVKPPEISQNRLEGVALASAMVPEGAQMDSLIQKAGIDKNTTIVFTTSDGAPPWFPVRGYFTFRYWGFPKDKLKVLNGYDRAWKELYPLATGAAQEVEPSGYSVKNNRKLNADMRMALGEMIGVVGKPGNVILDMRGGNTSPVYTGSAPVTLGVFPPATVATGLVEPPLLDATPDYTVFEGHMKGARALNYLELFVDGPKKDYTFLPEKTLKEKIAAVGASKAKPTYVYCRTGYIASISFFILDGVLGWPVKLYDGSWSQWGQMSGEAAKGGKLPADSKWRTDTAAMTEPYPIMYNLGRTVKVKTQTDPKAPAVATDKDFSLSPAHIESVTLDEKALKNYKPASPRASQIEREDAAYLRDRTN